MNSFLDHLNWRRASKHFDANRPLDEATVGKILEAVHMAPSSFGLQPFHVHVVSSPELKKQLRAGGYDQAQFEEASHILIFSARTEVMSRIDAYLEIASGGSSEAKEKMAPYADMMRGGLSKRSPEQIFEWSARQAYIALGFALAACAELEVTSCPMEGFSSADFDRILQLPETLKSVVVLSMGYESTPDSRPKVRFPESDLITKI